MKPTVPVSTIIPAYNAERYLGEAIDSVLAQTAVPRQLIVVDDGSSDATAAVAAGFDAVTLLTGLHAGVGAALNRGVAAVSEQYVAFLDADDLWLPEKLEKQLAAIERPAAAQLVFGSMESFYSPDASAELMRRIACPTQPVPGYAVGTLLTRRSVLEQVGAFETTLRVGHFIDWYNRAVDLKLTQVVLADVVLRRRLHGDNLSLREPAARTDFARVAKAALDRRRQRS
jgi:glycosyltransferase involved in cell wall biosynthesis